MHDLTASSPLPTLLAKVPTMNNRLSTIATRQRSSRLRDGAFALLVTFAAIVGASSVAMAADAAAPAAAQPAALAR